MIVDVATENKKQKTKLKETKKTRAEIKKFHNTTSAEEEGRSASENIKKFNIHLQSRLT